MDNTLNEWKGTQKDLSLAVNIRICEIMENFCLDKKTAIQVFCESLFRNLVINEMDNMINYLINGIIQEDF